MDNSIGSPVSWSVFVALVGVILVLDVTIVHRVPREISIRAAGAWTAVWVSLALLFGLGIAIANGPEPALAFLCAYLLEKSLSLDNLVVFLALFAYFDVPAKLQHRVLFLGILGAVVMRGAFILAGVALIARFHWLVYVLGGLLVGMGAKSLVARDTAPDSAGSLIVRMASRLLPVASSYGNGEFTVIQDGKRLASPLLIVVAVVELTDVLFATDSVPAVLSVTTDPFIAFTSNVLAVLGLRALFFLIAGILRQLRFLRLGISLVLIFVGGKMLVAPWFGVPVSISLLAIVFLLASSTLASVLFSPDATAHEPERARPREPDRTD